MNNETFIKSIEDTYAKGVAIIKRKNADYANSTNPFKNFESAGVVGVSIERAMLVRILDKLSRISNLIEKDAAVVDESMEDTLVDAINYLAILKAYRESKKATQSCDVVPNTRVITPEEYERLKREYNNARNAAK